MSAESDGHEKERSYSYFSPLGKRLVLGTVIERLGSAGSRKAWSLQVCTCLC